MNIRLTNRFSITVNIVDSARYIGLLVMRYIIDTPLVHKLAIDNPRCILNDFIDPFAMSNRFITLS